MKKIFLLIAFFAGVASVSYAQKVDDVGFENAKLRKNGELMTVSMGIDLAQLDVRNRRSVHIVPVLKNGADSLELAPVGIYSRGRYINYLRNGESVFEDLNETVYKEREAPEYINYSTNVDYQPWMDGAKVFVSKKTCGCCQDLKGEEVAAPAEEAEEAAASADPEIDALVAARTAAKKAKNFAEADRIRDELKAMGIEIIDTPQGTKWRKV